MRPSRRTFGLPSREVAVIRSRRPIRTCFADLRRLGRSGHPRRSHVPTAMDLQEHPEIGRCPGRLWAMSSAIRRSAGSWRAGLQPPSQPQDRGGQVPSRSRCPVRVHQPAGSARSRGGVSRSSRWTPRRRNWSGISRIRAGNGEPQGSAGTRSSRKDFKDKELGKVAPYGIYDSDDQRGLGQCGDRS